MKWADLWEQRVCPACGREFGAFGIWPDDAKCDSCSRVAYRKRMEDINSPRNFRVVSIGGACPTQSEGVTAGGRPFYFRARHGEWVLRLGPQGAPADYSEWSDDAVVVALGDDPSGGWMEDAEVLAILDAHCGGDE